MATEADISDHISPMKIELEDKERSTGNSKIESEEFIGVEKEVESGFTQHTLEARENIQAEKGTRAADFHVVNEGIVKAMEGDDLQSPSVADEELVQPNFTEKLSGAQKGDKNETQTDENIIVASNLDQNANRVTEPKGTLSEEDSAQMNFNSGDESQNKSSESLLTENERIYKVDNFEISKKESDLVVKDIVEDNLKNQPEVRKHEEVDNIITEERYLKETPEHEESWESSMNNKESATENVEMLVTKTSEGIETTPLSETPNQIPARETRTISNDVKELATPEEKSFQEFEESKIPNKGDRIDEDVNNEIDLSKDSNSEGMPNYTQESEVVAKIGEEEVSILGKKKEEPEESSLQKAQENRIRNNTEKSEDLSSFESEAPREEICEKKMEDSQAYETLTKIEEKEELEESSPKRAEENPIGNANEKLDDVSRFVSQAPTEELYEEKMEDTQENKISINIGKEKELEELSLLKSEENKSGDYIEKSEDVSSFKSQAPTEEIREEKIEDTKKCAEKFDIASGVTEATSSTEIKLIDKPLEEAPIMESQLLPEHEIEKKDIEKSKKLDAEYGVHDIFETTTSPVVERSGATDVEKIIREVPNQQVLPLEQGSEADYNAETAPCQATQAEEIKEQFPVSSFVLLSGKENSQNESKAAIEDKTGLEGSDVAEETNEIDETLTSANAEENEEVSDNNGAETSESVTKSNYHCDEDEIAEKTETEFIKQDADGLAEEKLSELTHEIKVQRVEETDNTKAQLPQVDTHAGEEDEESKDVPKTVTESRYRGAKSVIEGNTSPDDAEIGKTRNQTEGSCKADQPEELRRADPEALSEPTDHIVEEVSNNDIVAPKEATEEKTLNEIQLNDNESVNFTNSSATAESIETTENDDMNQQGEGIEKVNLDDAIIDVSGRMHEDEQRDSGRDKVDNEVEEAITSDHKDKVVEDTPINEEKEITEAVPASISEIDCQGVGAIIEEDISPEPCSILINDRDHEATTEMDMVNAESINKNESLFEKNTQETTGTVDTSKQDPEVDDIKLEENFTVESQLLGHDNEREASESKTKEKTDAESESLGHNVEKITETDSSPAMRDTQTSGMENVLIEVPEEIHQASEDGGKIHTETVEKSDVDVVKAEEATWFDAESKDIVEEIYEGKATPNIEIFIPDGRKEERDGLAERMSAVDDETDERPLATGESEEYLESSSALLSVLKYGSVESEFLEIEKDSDVLSFEESHKIEATPAVEKTQASKVKQETKESLETIPEPKCHDVGATIDQEILSNQIFPLENVEGSNNGVEETDIAPTRVSEVTNLGEVNHSYKAIEDFDIRSNCKTLEITKTVDTYQHDPELESINPEGASIVESKPEEHESIEAQERLAEAKTEVGDVEIETPKVLGVESESSSIEEIHEENVIPLAGETGFGASDSIDGISPTRMNQEENFEGDVLNLSSHENEESSTKITESDSLELNETSGMLSQLQNTETRLTSDAGEDKNEEAKGCDDLCESKDGQEEINGTRTSLIAEVPCKVKMVEETNRLDDKISDTEEIQEVVPAAESTSVSKCQTENPGVGEDTEHPTDDEPGVAIISESLSKSRVLGVENIDDTEASPSVGETHPDREDDEKPKVQAVDGVHGTTVPSAREDGINDTYQENREAPETTTKEINQDAGAVSRKEITLTQPIEKGKTEKQEEESFDTVPESKDQNFEEDYDTKSIPAAEIHETDTTKEDGSEVLEKISGGTCTGFEAIVDGQTQATTTDRETVFEPNNQGVEDSIQNEINMQPNESLPDMLEDKKQQSINEDGIIKADGTSNNNNLLNENAFDSLEARRTDEESSATPVDEKCTEDFHLEVEKIGKALQPKSEIHDSELEHIPEVTANVDEKLKEAVVNPGEGGSENRDENTTEAAQATHEISSGETLAEEHKKAEANTLREPIICDYRSVETPEQVSVEMGTVNVNAAEEETYMEYVEKEPITENAGKEGDPAEATRSIKEVKIPEVTQGNHENTLGHYNDEDEIAIAKVSNFENQVEKENMEDEFSLPACEEKGNEGSVGIEEQESITNATYFSSEKTTSGEELADKRETKVDEKQLDFTQDPASVISSVEEQVEKPLVIPEANNQKATGDVTETKELMKEPQEPEKISPSLSDTGDVTENKDQNEQKENKKAIANRDFQATSEDSVVAKQVDSKEEKVGEESPETKNKFTPNDPAEVLSSEILDQPKDQMNQVHEEPKTEAEERIMLEKEETNEEEEDGNKKAYVIPSVEEHIKMPLVTLEANNPKAAGDVTEPKELMKEPQEQEKISLSLSDAQIAGNGDLNEEKENIKAIARRDFQATSGDPTEAKQVDPKKDKVGDKSPETTKELTPNNPPEVLSSEILDTPIDHINQVAEEPKSPVEEEKTDEEEEDENKKANSGSDAPVMVETWKDIDVKTPRKKSHNIFSGVGSKMKHSIAKVKKAVTGKSSHEKASSPKEDKKKEAASLL